LDLKGKTMVRHLARLAVIAVAVGLTLPADSAQADLIQNYGYALASVSYSPDLVARLGISMHNSHEWYARESSLHSGDATNETDSGYYYLDPTFAQAYASAIGIANAGSGTPSSSQSSSVTAASYLWLYNSNTFDVMLPIRSYHYNYAWANSEALYSGGAGVIAQNFVDVYNYAVSVAPYNVEAYYAKAISLGSYGVSGPFISEEEFFYDVRLTPGDNYIVARVTVDTEGFVSVPSPVPEPGTLTLAALGLFSFAGIACRRCRAERSL
jgi:hypothetical protein